MSNCDNCAEQKTESKEFAFFAGVDRGKRLERAAILDQLRSHRTFLMTGIRALDEVIQLIEKRAEK